MGRHGLVAVLVLTLAASAFGASREKRVQSNFEALYPSSMADRAPLSPGRMAIPSSRTAMEVELRVDGKWVSGRIGPYLIDSWRVSGSAITGMYKGEPIHLTISGNFVRGTIHSKTVNWYYSDGEILGTLEE